MLESSTSVNVARMVIRPRVLLIGLAASVLALTAFLALRTTRVRTAPVRLSDGTTLHFKSASTGTNSVFHSEGILKRQARKWLPSRFHSLLGPPGMVMGGQGPENEARFWFVRTTLAPGGRVTGCCQGAVAIDADGSRFPNIGMGTMSSPQSQVVEGVYFAFQSLPRREPMVRIELQTFSGPIEMLVPNPVWKPEFPVWVASPLPQTIATNGYSFILDSVRLRPRAKGQAYLDNQFRILRDGLHCEADWSVIWELEDPTGNNSYFALPRSEPVWKIIGQFTPNGGAKLDPSSWRPLGDFNAPKPGEHLPLPANLLSDLGVSYAVLLGPGDYSIRDGEVISASTHETKKAGAETAEAGQSTWSARLASNSTRVFAVLRGKPGSTPTLDTRQPVDRNLLVRFRNHPTAGRFREIILSMNAAVVTRLVSWDFDLKQGGVSGKLDAIPLTTIRVPFLIAPPNQPAIPAGEK